MLTPRSASAPSACSAPTVDSPLAWAMLRPSSSTITISLESFTGWPDASTKLKSASTPGLAFANTSAETASSSRRKLRSTASVVSSRCAALPASRTKVSSRSAGVR